MCQAIYFAESIFLLTNFPNQEFSSIYLKAKLRDTKTLILTSNPALAFINKSSVPVAYVKI